MTAVCPACNAADLAVDVAETVPRVTLSVPSMRCAACIGTLEGALHGLPGVRSARVNLTQKRVNVDTDLPRETLVKALADVGYEAFAFDASALSSDTDAVGRDLILRLGVAGFAMMNVMLLSVAVWSGAADATRDLFHLISAAIALPAALFSAKPFFVNASKALRVWRLNMDVPISLAIILAGGMSLYESLNGGHDAYFDAALSLTFFLLIGRVLEHRTRATARSAAQELSALESHTALRKVDGKVEEIRSSDLAVGDRILVPTGMRVPADGTLIGAEAFTDRSFLTGESEPVAHGAGAMLRAGEINLAAPIEIDAVSVGDDTGLRQMARLVETAENVRNSYTSLADRAAAFYAPVVHILAALTFAGWMFYSGDLRQSLNVAIAVLIITCPCALGLAVPAVSTAAIGRLYRKGFLVKSGTALERLAEVKSVVLDKTGTLTRPGFAAELDHLSAEDRSVAKALAEVSAHPLSRALNQHLGDIAGAQIAEVVETPGQGVSGLWNGVRVALGRDMSAGQAVSGLVLQIGAVRTPLPYREIELPGAEGLSAGLKKAGLEVSIISGDTKTKTAAMADRLGVANFEAGMSPEEKHTFVAEKARAGERVCMIGDGINDTIALTAAHASIAPGSALDAARNVADVVMLGETLDDVPDLFRTARKAARLSVQNFGIAFTYNAIAIPLAIMGYASPIAAALAMSGSSICVILNALRVR